MSIAELKKTDLSRCFDLVNEQLAVRNKNGGILPAGGAALTLVYNARESTMDIDAYLDAYFRPKEDMRPIIICKGWFI